MTTCVVAGSAFAGPALDEPATPPPADATQPTTETPTEAQLDPTVAANHVVEDEVKYGVALRFRNVRVPRAILELFLERSAGGASSLGIGAEFIRRRGNVELQFGIEYEKLQVGEGVWIDSGDDVSQGAEADYVINSDDANTSLGWVTFEFTFLNHAPINKYIAIRYGGGAGLGVLTGELKHYNVQCNGGSTNDNPEPGCVPTVISGGQASSFNGPVAYDLPPVFPVINAIIGVQITPVENLVINLEGGIRTAPFFGTSIGYFF